MKLIAKRRFHFASGNREFTCFPVGKEVEAPDWVADEQYFKLLRRAGDIVVTVEPEPNPSFHISAPMTNPVGDEDQGVAADSTTELDDNAPVDSGEGEAPASAPATDAESDEDPESDTENGEVYKLSDLRETAGYRSYAEVIAALAAVGHPVAPTADRDTVVSFEAFQAVIAHKLAEDEASEG